MNVQSITYQYLKGINPENYYSLKQAYGREHFDQQLSMVEDALKSDPVRTFADPSTGTVTRPNILCEGKIFFMKELFKAEIDEELYMVTYLEVVLSEEGKLICMETRVIETYLSEHHLYAIVERKVVPKQYPDSFEEFFVL